MNAGQKRIRQLVAKASFDSQHDICSSCLRRLVHRSRHYATAAVAEAPSPQSDGLVTTSKPLQDAKPQKAYRLLISPVISRPPLLTRELTPFEESFYLYQKRLNERVALPLTRYFYYRKRSPAESEWKRKIKVRKTPARDIGVYSGYGADSWNDEVLVGNTYANRDDTIERLILDGEGRYTTTGLLVDKKAAKAEAAAKAGEAAQKEDTTKVEERQIERPSPRLTEADQKNDMKSLNRKLDRSLYLIVKNAAGNWSFPEDRMVDRESLHQAAERIIVQAAGVNMNTWVLANHPSGHFEKTYPQPQLVELAKTNKLGEAMPYKRIELGEKTFFMKTRIMTGQADITSNALGVTDFQWLAKEEVEERVHPSYWSYIRNMLTER